MTLDTNARRLDQIRKLLKYSNGIDLMYGNLGTAVAHIYHGSLTDNEEIYDFGSDVLQSLFGKIKDHSYLNHQIELPILGYVLERMNKGELVEMDTDEILADADGLIMSQCYDMKFNKFSYVHNIAFCYYIGSRVLNKTTDSNNFMFVQMLIIRLIDISISLPEIIEEFNTSTEFHASFIELFFNLDQLCGFLYRNNVCNGFGENISQKLRQINYAHVNTEFLNLYHVHLLNCLTGEKAMSHEILANLLNRPLQMSATENRLTIAQLFTLIYMARSNDYSNDSTWYEFGPVIKNSLEAYFANRRSDNKPLQQNSMPGITGLSVFSLIACGGDNLFFKEFINLLPLLHISSFKIETTIPAP